MRHYLVGKIFIALHFVIFVFSIAVITEPALAAQGEESVASVGENPGRYDREQAKEVIEAHGYYNVRELTQDKMGVWRGTAIRYGQTVNVRVDQQGNFYD
jgi:hypothetical protein